MEMDFTIKSYKQLIRTLKNHKYNCIFYDELGSFETEIMIRHDIDFSLEKALEIAILEYELKVKSTFFLLIGSPFYNIHDKRSKYIIKRIVSLGHKIGLHFDQTVYEDMSIESIMSNTLEEIKILSIAVGSNINVVSFHRPSKYLLDSNIMYPNGIINTYSEKFFKEVTYISDSRMNWKKNPFSILSDLEHKKVQLLMHPIWYNHEIKDASMVLRDFYNLTVHNVYDNMSSNFTNLSEFLDKSVEK